MGTNTLKIRKDLEAISPLVEVLLTAWSASGGANAPGWSDQAHKALAEAAQHWGDRGTLVLGASDPDDEPLRGVSVRAGSFRRAADVPYAALIPAGQPSSGGYAGASLVLFPRVVADADDSATASDRKPSASRDRKGSASLNRTALLTLCVGTDGLGPDQDALARPGHARRLAALAGSFREMGFQVWTKSDPCRVDIPIPQAFVTACAGLDEVIARKYGSHLYFIVDVADDANPRLPEVAALMLAELLTLRGAASGNNDRRRWADEQRSAALSRVYAAPRESELIQHLRRRRFVILEGPPGTGKTRLAQQVLQHYRAQGGGGALTTFHPSVTYESFVGGLSPEAEQGQMLFRPRAGTLLRAIAAARALPPTQRYLLVIDEINRADLAKVLGEAITLFEPGESRSVDLPYAFSGFDPSVSLPENLDVLGTMNSSDRSIALLDHAIRRRFAFWRLWPDAAVLDSHGLTGARDYFDQLFALFVEHASDDVLALVPGHSYFLRRGDAEESIEARIQQELRPLLEEYLAQGLVSGFAEEIRGFLALARPRA
jgi:5-methylcytosine-specific restriction protein B